jgi:predicted nucleotidyltransferase
MAKLQGKNQIRKFEQIAERLTSEVVARRGVAGVIFIGGLVRGYADRYSDVDIIVFLDRKDEDLREQLKKIGYDEQEHSGVDVDFEVHFFEDFARWKWDEIDRWDFSQAEIVFDPQGKIKKLFSGKLRVPKGFWTKRIVIYAEYLKWYCCPPKEDMETMADAWVARGDLVSAHYCVNYAFDLLMSVIFALNKEFLPPQKWRIFYSYSLKWLPRGYKRFVEETMTVKSLSVQDLERRLHALKKMWRQVSSKIREETGLTTDVMSKLYVKKGLHQT